VFVELCHIVSIHYNHYLTRDSAGRGEQWAQTRNGAYRWNDADKPQFGILDHMKTLVFLILLTASSSPALAAKPKFDHINGTIATDLSEDNSYLRTPRNRAYDYWSLSSYFEPQKNGYSCSAASVSMALNALLNTRRMRTDEEENITQVNLLEKTGDADWTALLSEAGLNGKHGVTLSRLENVAKKALAAHGAANATITATAVEKDDAATLERFRSALISNERNPEDIMLLHYVQDTVTGATDGPFPHVSPVGAYDAKTHRVLIMDVDRRWYGPYWAADTQVLKAMAQETEHFGRGGYLILRR